MAALSNAVKVLIVQRLACFESPSVIRDELKADYGIDVSIPQIVYYKPSATREPAAKMWVDLFHETRQQYVADTSDQAISHRSFRLSRLERMARALERKADETKSPGLAGALYERAAKMYEQAAKEQGNVFTNRRELTGAKGGPVAVKAEGGDPLDGLDGMTDEELATFAASLATGAVDTTDGIAA